MQCAMTCAVRVPVVAYDAPAPTVECAASVTTITESGTVVTQPVDHGYDYFSDSIAYDVWYADYNLRGSSFPWRRQDTSAKQESMHCTNETIDHDIRPGERPESRRECQWSLLHDL